MSLHCGENSSTVAENVYELFCFSILPKKSTSKTPGWLVVVLVNLYCHWWGKCSKSTQDQTHECRLHAEGQIPEEKRESHTHTHLFKDFAYLF